MNKIKIFSRYIIKWSRLSFTTAAISYKTFVHSKIFIQKDSKLLNRSVILRPMILFATITLNVLFILPVKSAIFRYIPFVSCILCLLIKYFVLSDSNDLSFLLSAMRFLSDSKKLSTFNSSTSSK